MSDGPRQIYVVWSPTGPIAAYTSPVPAGKHAGVMLGVSLSTIDLRDDLPEHVREDINSDYDGDDDTPVITVDELDEK